MPYVSGRVDESSPEIVFRPGVLVGAEFLVGGVDRRVMATQAGAYLVRLDPGEYQVWRHERPWWRIVVPEAEGTYDVHGLIREAYPQPGGRRPQSAGGDYVSRTGDAMSGALLLHADPREGDSDLQAATKGYVDRLAATYTHTQSAPATEWVVIHNLGRNPSVTVTDLSGAVLDPAIVFDPDRNRLTIYCNSAETGYAYLN